MHSQNGAVAGLYLDSDWLRAQPHPGIVKEALGVPSRVIMCRRSLMGMWRILCLLLIGPGVTG